MNFISEKIQHFGDILLHSKFCFVWLPLFITFLWFLETVWIFGFFIPMEIIAVSYFAFIHQYLYLFLLATFVFGVGVFLGLIAWYFIWKKYYKLILAKVENKFPVTKDYFKKIDEYMEKYHFWMFPLLINIWYTRPIMALHLGWRGYNFRKFLIWSIFATISYVIPRVFIWYLIWIFWKIIVEYLKIWYKYLIFIVIVLVIVYFIYDAIRESKQLKWK